MSDIEPEGSVHFARCRECGRPMFPIMDRLPCGHSKAPSLEPFSEPGVVYSWTKSFVGPTGDPQLIAMVDFFDGELRVTGPVLQLEGVEIGQNLVIVPSGGSGFCFSEDAVGEEPKA